MLDDIKERLKEFGYEVTSDDTWVLNFIIQGTKNRIKDLCNTSDVPTGLYHIAVDMVVGEFLFSKKNSGQLQLTSLDLTAAIKSIDEGDASITFAIGNKDGSKTPEQRFDILIAYLMHPEADFASYRCIKW